jgi:hypothetical protein
VRALFARLIATNARSSDTRPILTMYSSSAISCASLPALSDSDCGWAVFASRPIVPIARHGRRGEQLLLERRKASFFSEMSRDTQAIYALMFSAPVVRPAHITMRAAADKNH